MHLGLFNDENEARKEYLKAKEKYHNLTESGKTFSNLTYK